MSRVCRKGFTLVELSLSVAFISILSITVALIINDTVSSYQRGLTLNKINTAGMELVDDMRAVIQSAPAGALKDVCSTRLSEGAADKCRLDNAHKFVSVSRIANVSKSGESTIKNIPVFGAFCTGSYSYIWNSGYFFANGYSIREPSGAIVNMAKLVDGSGNTLASDFKLLKVKDKSFAVCTNATTGGDSSKYGEKISSDFVLGGIIFEEPEDLLSNNESESTDNNLAFYDLYSGVPAINDSGSALFYTVSFVLGTVQGGVNVKASGDFCKTPADYKSNFDYCAINKFNFAAQAIGG